MTSTAFDTSRIKNTILSLRAVLPAVHRRRTIYKRKDAANKLLNRETILISFIPPAMEVKRIRKYGNSSYPVCPWCALTLDREYQLHCDRCGQPLAWNIYDSGDKDLLRVVQRVNAVVHK